jgi:hypothetical protein
MYRQHPNRSRGAALLIFVIFFMFASLALALGIGRGVYGDILRYRVLEHSKEAFFGADAGAEDAIHRHRKSKNYSSSEQFALGDTLIFVTRTNDSDGFYFNVHASTSNAHRSEYVALLFGSGGSFAYGLQSDTGGITMENSSSVLGNVYSNGVVQGTGIGAGSLVAGSIISAGPGGLIDGVHATGTVWAHSIDDSTVDGDAHYYATSTLTASTVSGTKFASSSDHATSSLPFSDTKIEGYKADAEAGGIIASTDPECSSGIYTIDVDTTIGPVKIECDVIVDKSATDLTLAGPVWIVGNLTTKSGPSFHVDPLLIGKTIAIIADNPSARATSSKIVLQNSALFFGAGTGSYILLISQNNDEELGGPTVAINSKQSASGDLLLYAGHGEILVEQSGQYVGITGLHIRLQNSAQIIYETGAVSLDFPAGPGGGFLVGTWKEIE